MPFNAPLSSCLAGCCLCVARVVSGSSPASLRSRYSLLHGLGSLFKQFPFPRLPQLSEPCPVVKIPFLASFSFRAETSSAFISRSADRTRGLLVRIVTQSGPVLGDNTLPTFLSTVSLVFGAIGAFGETRSIMPKMPSFSTVFPRG